MDSRVLRDTQEAYRKAGTKRGAAELLGISESCVRARLKQTEDLFESRETPEELSERNIREAIDGYNRAGSLSKAAELLGISSNTIYGRIRTAIYRGIPVDGPAAKLGPRGHLPYQEPEYKQKPFEVETLPSPLPTVEELLARRKEEFARVDASKRARKLIPVKIKIDGPIGIAHGGDPHLDDPGTNIALLEEHANIINRTEGLFGANVGDMANHWVGRLARLHGEQTTTAREAWILVEWYINKIHWIYLIQGNHDCWCGANDPLQWIIRAQPTGVFEAHGARLELQFPNGRTIRINARHDFAGSSMWNPAHGPSKAAQSGWRDDILTCGHKHISGYAPVKDPASGMLSHAIRVASYKTHDRYADEKGLPNQNFSECITTVINPEAKTESSLISVFFDLGDAAEFLTWLRGRRLVKGARLT